MFREITTHNFTDAVGSHKNDRDAKLEEMESQDNAQWAAVDAFLHQRGLERYLFVPHL